MNDQKLFKSVDLRLASMLFISVLPRPHLQNWHNKVIAMISDQPTCVELSD